jgi:hypothetical protein
MERDGVEPRGLTCGVAGDELHAPAGGLATVVRDAGAPRALAT